MKKTKYSTAESVRLTIITEIVDADTLETDAIVSDIENKRLAMQKAKVCLVVWPMAFLSLLLFGLCGTGPLSS